MTFKECTENTPIKHEHFRKIMGMHVSLWKAITKKESNAWMDKRYYYLDLNSGPGIYPNGLVCSPISFLRIAKRNNIDYKALFIENNKKYFRILADHTGKNNRVSLICDDNLIVAQQLCEYDIPQRKSWCGVVYADPMGAGKGEFEASALIAQQFPRMDILFHLQAASIKRCSHHSVLNEEGYLSLSEYIKGQIILDTLDKTAKEMKCK
jgi:three-Cys-motif partner protein